MGGTHNELRLYAGGWEEALRAVSVHFSLSILREVAEKWVDAYFIIPCSILVFFGNGEYGMDCFISLRCIRNDAQNRVVNDGLLFAEMLHSFVTHNNKCAKGIIILKQKKRDKPAFYLHFNTSLLFYNPDLNRTFNIRMKLNGNGINSERFDRLVKNDFPFIYWKALVI